MKARGGTGWTGALFYEVCHHKQKYILAVEIISSHWASNDWCGVCICCKNIWMLVQYSTCVVGEVILRTGEGLNSLHFEEHERLLSHIAGICNLPLRLHILTRTTFFCCSSSLFTRCAASVHCTSKLIILQLKCLLLVLWHIWNDDKVKGSAVSSFVCLTHESVLMKWGKVSKGEKMSIRYITLLNKFLHSRRHTQLQEMNKWFLRKIWPPS